MNAIWTLMKDQNSNQKFRLAIMAAILACAVINVVAIRDSAVTNELRQIVGLTK